MPKSFFKKLFSSVLTLSLLFQSANLFVTEETFAQEQVSLPPCYLEGQGGTVANVSLAVGSFCVTSDGKPKKLFKPYTASDSGTVFDFSRCLRFNASDQKELNQILKSKEKSSENTGSKNSNAQLMKPEQDFPDVAKSEADEEIPLCADCRMRTGVSMCSSCREGNELNTIKYPPYGSPDFTPVEIPGMNPSTVFCGGSNPVLVKGVLLCGCKEVINSRIVTNPVLQEGQYCASQDRIYIAKNCKKTVDPNGNSDLLRRGLVKSAEQVNNECDLEKAPKKDIKIIKWVQKNQRSGLGLPVEMNHTVPPLKSSDSSQKAVAPNHPEDAPGPQKITIPRTPEGN